MCVYIYIFYIFLKYNALYSGVYYYSFKACLNESKMFAFANGLINNQACFEKSYIYIYSFIYSIRQNSIYCAVYYYSYSHIHHIWFYIFHKIKFSMFWSVLFIQSTLKWKWDAGFCQWRYKQVIIFGKGLSLAAPENWTQGIDIASSLRDSDQWRQ